MHLNDFTFLLHKPEAVNATYGQSLDQLVEAFPYLQSARMLQLKLLYQQQSYRYNTALKKAAAHTYDRGVLFDFICADHFTAIHKGAYEKNADTLPELVVVDAEWVRPEANEPSDEVTETPMSDEVVTALESKLELGKPLSFTPDEKHSFHEWLQLTRLQPIVRTPETPVVESSEPPKGLSKKLDLIDQFITSNPKITPPSKDAVVAPLPIKEPDPTPLMTETLAQVYLEQKKYAKAIQAYEILILKYPEKNSFFAARIADIKELQQHTSNQ